jgi:hypothetical protein
MNFIPKSLRETGSSLAVMVGDFTSSNIGERLKAVELKKRRETYSTQSELEAVIARIGVVALLDELSAPEVTLEQISAVAVASEVTLVNDSYLNGSQRESDKSLLVGASS